MRKLLSIFVAALICAPAGEARAAWHEVKSRHFIIYSNDSPKALHEFATRLEKFDGAARTLLRMEDPPLGDGNRLTIFVLPTEADVRKLAGDKSGFLKGFYSGRASGSLAYVPKRTDGGSRSEFGAETVFYHEYAHHLMMQQLSHPFPEWYVEGFAEFLSVPKFDKDGSVGLGTPPQHRAGGLFYGKPLPLEALLGGTYSKISQEERESIYGRGWLLVHYLTMEPKRDGQLRRYILSISEGAPPLEAARSAFGDLRQLDKELGAYLKRRSIRYFKLTAAQFSPGPIEVKPLSAGAAEVLLHRARLKKGIDEEENEALAAQLRQLQARYPGDEMVELTLAEAELDAARFEAAEAAADRAAKANPRSTEALVLKGRAVLERATDFDGDARDLFAQARRHFIGANTIDPEDPEPLMEFYKSFVREGVRPTANAIEALHYASNLAPQDLGLRMNSAVAYLNEGKLKEARITLVPVAYSPHGGGIAEAARHMIAKIDAGDAKGALQPPAAPSPSLPAGSL